jgi:hypothetical protein
MRCRSSRRSRGELCHHVTQERDEPIERGEAFAKKLEAAKRASKTTVATGIIDDVE